MEYSGAFCSCTVKLVPGAHREPTCTASAWTEKKHILADDERRKALWNGCSSQLDGEPDPWFRKRRVGR
jgi:hypothetical protein